MTLPNPIGRPTQKNVRADSRTSRKVFWRMVFELFADAAVSLSDVDATTTAAFTYTASLS